MRFKRGQGGVGQNEQGVEVKRKEYRRSKGLQISRLARNDN